MPRYVCMMTVYIAVISWVYCGREPHLLCIMLLHLSTENAQLIKIHTIEQYLSLYMYVWGRFHIYIHLYVVTKFLFWFFFFATAVHGNIFIRFATVPQSMLSIWLPRSSITLPGCKNIYTLYTKRCAEKKICIIHNSRHTFVYNKARFNLIG